MVRYCSGIDSLEPTSTPSLDLYCVSPEGDCQGQATSPGLVLSSIGEKIGVDPLPLKFYFSDLMLMAQNETWVFLTRLPHPQEDPNGWEY